MRDNTLEIIIKILIKINTLYYTCILASTENLYKKPILSVYHIFYYNFKYPYLYRFSYNYYFYFLFSIKYNL